MDKMAAEVTALKEELRGKTTAESLDRKELLARLENLDRSIQEMLLTIQQAEIARKREWDMVRELLGEERLERREGVKQVVEEKKEKRSQVVAAVQAIWEKGGQWIVAAICLWLVLQVRSCAEIDLTKVFPHLGG